MKTTLKKQIEEITNNDYEVLFEGTEKLTQEWKYYVIWNKSNHMYLAGWNTTQLITKYDFREFETYQQAKEYIKNSIE